MNEVEKLNEQHLFEKSGESYLKLTREVFKELAQEPILFQSIIDFSDNNGGRRDD